MTVTPMASRRPPRPTAEKLPDINGTKITYAGGVECQITVMERRNDEPTITAGATRHRGRPHRRLRERERQAPAAVQAGWGVVWETDHVLATEGDSV